MTSEILIWLGILCRISQPSVSCRSTLDCFSLSRLQLAVEAQNNLLEVIG